MLLFLLPRRKFPVLVRYTATAAIVGAAALLRAALEVPMQQSPLLLFVPAVFLCSLLFNSGSGFFATLLSAAIAAYFFMGPAGNFAFGVPGFVFIIVFIIIGLTIAAVTEALRKAVHKFNDATQHQALLMREMAHRVKNDLALISSAISLQARTSENEAVREAPEAANARVHVIAAAQALLRSGDGGAVDLPSYIQNLCDGLGRDVARNSADRHSRSLHGHGAAGSGRGIGWPDRQRARDEQSQIRLSGGKGWHRRSRDRAA